MLAAAWNESHHVLSQRDHVFADLGGGDTDLMARAKSSRKKIKTNVDRRASKGRKIRYLDSMRSIASGRERELMSVLHCSSQIRRDAEVSQLHGSCAECRR